VELSRNYLPNLATLHGCARHPHRRLRHRPRRHRRDQNRHASTPSSEITPVGLPKTTFQIWQLYVDAPTALTTASATVPVPACVPVHAPVHALVHVPVSVTVGWGGRWGGRVYRAPIGRTGVYRVPIGRSALRPQCTRTGSNARPSGPARAALTRPQPPPALTDKT